MPSNASAFELHRKPFDINNALIRNTLNISHAVLAELGQRAASSGRPFKEGVEESLQLGLAGTVKTNSESTLPTYPV
jgi:hypothetical protein